MKLLFIMLILITLIPFLYLNNHAKIYNHYFKTQPMISGKVSNDDKIFVSIASYRDPQLITTIKSLKENCYDFSKIKIVICEQNSINDNFHLKNGENIEIIKMDYKLARGPTWARYLIQQKWKGEQFYLQIDSHTRFVKHWDRLLRSQLSLLPSKSCLSNYVSTYDINTGKVLKLPLRGPMFIQHIDPKDKFYRFNSNYVKTLKSPVISNGWSGCFSFSSSQIIIDVPYDPYLPFLFFGEEMEIYKRLVSRGWTMYVPSVPICFTLFDRSYRHTFWEHPDYKKILPFSKQRLYAKFGWTNNVNTNLLKELDIYGLKKQ